MPFQRMTEFLSGFPRFMVSPSRIPTTAELARTNLEVVCDLGRLDGKFLRSVVAPRPPLLLDDFGSRDHARTMMTAKCSFGHDGLRPSPISKEIGLWREASSAEVRHVMNSTPRASQAQGV